MPFRPLYKAYTPKHQIRNKWICLVSTYSLYMVMVALTDFLTLPFIGKMITGIFMYGTAHMFHAIMLRYFPWVREIKYDEKIIEVKDPKVPKL